MSHTLGSRIAGLKSRSLAALGTTKVSRPEPKARDLLLLFLLLLFATPIRAQKGDAEKALFRLEDDFAQAVVKRDARALGRIVAPKWVYSDESGVMERGEGIKAFTSGSDTVTRASNANMRALIYGDAAVVIGVLQMNGRGPKGPFVHRYRYTDAWAKIDGRWQCIASQDYLMPNAKR
jgi:ketosteroid isomerase-like protein